MYQNTQTLDVPGLNADVRAEIIRKISLFGEGALFRIEDLGITDDQKDTFLKMGNLDYFKVTANFYCGVVQGKYVTRWPKLSILFKNIEDTFNCKLRPTGDRVAWKVGLKKWEPIKGHRYYTTGESCFIRIGNFKVEFINGPEWLVDETITQELSLAIMDTHSDKDSYREAVEWLKSQSTNVEQLVECRKNLLNLDGKFTEDSENDETICDLQNKIQGAMEYTDRLLKSVQR